MSGDTLVFDQSISMDVPPSIFVKKEFISVLDNQNGNYQQNQSVIDTSQLSNSNKFIALSEAYLSIPMVLTLTAQGLAPQTAATSCDYSIGLKSWFGNVIHSVQCEYNGVQIIQPVNWCNMFNAFRLLTTLSYNDIVSGNASSIGFYPDTSTSFTFYTNATAGGIGTCNNNNAGLATVVTGFHNSYESTNYGFLKRQQFINYDVTGLTGVNGDAFSTLSNANDCNQLYRSYIYNKAATIMQIQVQATVYLRHLHSFFVNLPLLKGVFLKMTLNLNQCSTTITKAAGTYAVSNASVTSPLGGVVPFMFASASAGNGSATTGAADGAIIISNAVGRSVLNPLQQVGAINSSLNQSVQLVCPAYVFNEDYERSYLNNPIKRIVYTDLYQYTVPLVSAGQSFNQLITNGISGIKSVLIIPVYSSASNSNINPILSPFDTTGSGTTSPLVGITNFNVVVSGQNMIYNSQSRLYENFNNNLNYVNKVNAGLTDGLTSGLITSLDADMNYCYYYVDCSRSLPIEDTVPKSISIQGTLQCQKDCSLYVFVEYQVQISIDVLTGARV